MSKEDVFFHVLQNEPLEAFVELAKRDARLLSRRNSAGDFLLHRAVQKERIDAARFLLLRGASPSQPGHGGATPLHYAAQLEKFKLMRILLTRTNDVEPPNHNGIRPLHIAAANGRLEAVKALLQGGASVWTLDKLGRLPIHHASGAGQEAVVRELLRHDSELAEASDLYGQRPLHWAALFLHPNLFRILEDCGGDPEAPDYYGRSPDFLNRISMVTGAPGKPGSGGSETPCPHYFVYGNNIEGLLQELESGCNLLEKNELGRNVLHLAGFLRHRRIYDFLSRSATTTDGPPVRF